MNPENLFSSQLMLEIPFNSVRRWQLVVVKCLVSQSQHQASSSDQPKFGRFLTPSPSLDGEKPPPSPLPKEPKEGSSQLEADFAVMIKGAPEVILRCNWHMNQ